MGIFINEEKIRQEIEKELRAKMELEFTEAEKKAETLIYLAQEEANKIIKEAKAEAEKIKEQARKQIENEKKRFSMLADECGRHIATINLLKRIVREKNLKNLRNLAQSVPMARVKKEVLRANKQLIYLDDIEKDIENMIEKQKSLKT